jgi:predicted DsbA family dithiol-disulfide isomerase
MAVVSPQVTADVIEANEFPRLAQRYAVRAVPKVVINDAVEFTGALPEPYFLEAVKRALPKPEQPAEASAE